MTTAESLDAAISRVMRTAPNYTEAAAALRAEGHDVSRWTVSRRAKALDGAAGPAAEVAPLPSPDLPVEELLERRVHDFRRKRFAREARDNIPVRVNVEGPIGIAFTGDPHCLTEDHEILTDRGWLRHHEISFTDRVAGVDMDGRFSWQGISRIIARVVEGEEILTSDSQSLSLACTLQHRVVCDRMSGGVYGPRRYEMAQNLVNSQIRVPVSAWKTDLDPHGSLTDDEVRLAAWLLTDTSWRTYKGRVRAFTIHQSKPEGVAKIRSLLERLGLPFNEGSRTRRDDGSRLLDGRPIVSNFDEVRFCLEAETTDLLLSRLQLLEKGVIPSWAWELSREQFRVFLNTLVDADGCRPSVNVVRVTKSLKLLDQLQALATKHGYKSTLRVEGPGWGTISLLPCETVTIKPKHHLIRKVYNGTVWCVTVSYGNFFTRRGGMVHLTGNCDSDGTDVETLFNHADLLGTNPHILSINLGDIRNNWIGRLARLYGEQGTSAKQALQLSKHYLERAKFNVVVLGNHDQWSATDDPIAEFLKGLGTLCEPNSARLTFHLPSGRTVRVHAAHTFPGRSQYNNAFGAAKKAQFDGAFDIYASGHIHCSGYQFGWNASHRLMWHAVQVASYKVYDSYADALGFDQALPVVCPVAIVDPAADDPVNFVRWEWDPFQAAERLAWMRSRC